MSDREQLMEILDADSMRPVGSTEDFLVRVRNDGDVFDNGPLADALTAAGWRLVPEGAVVVSGEDVLQCHVACDKLGFEYEDAPERQAYWWGIRDRLQRAYMSAHPVGAALEDDDG